MEPAFSLKHINNGNKTINNSTDAFPSTAYDYLRHVQQEAAQCPDVVVADIDCSLFNANQDANYHTVEPIKKSEGDKEASVRWQDEQVPAFAEIRQFLAHQKAVLKEKKIKKRKMPIAENENQWFQFCFGNKQHTQGNQCEEETEHGNTMTENNVDYSSGTPALLSIISQMNQSTVLKVLDHHIGWLETKAFTMLQGQWIYALLTAVEKPLHPDTTYSLRRLARLCSKHKESLTAQQTEEMAALYLIIILVMRYFGQSDLAEPL